MAVQASQDHLSGHFVGFPLQDCMDINGFVFGNSGLYDFSQSLLQQHHYHHQEMIQNQPINQICGQVVGSSSSSSLDYYNLPSMGFSPQLLAAQAEKQRREIDVFIALQNKSLTKALQEQSKQHQLVLLKRLEFKTMSVLRQKDEDLAKASRKTMELENCIRKMEVEKQAWQTVATENESMVISLNHTLEQVREKAFCCLTASGAEDAESWCCLPSSSSCSKGSEKEERKKRMRCKACNFRNSCVLFLPCRHVCSCKACESLLNCCPVCKSVKKGCMDVFMS